MGDHVSFVATPGGGDDSPAARRLAVAAENVPPLDVAPEPDYPEFITEEEELPPMSHVAPDITPNTGLIENPDIRRGAGYILYAISILSALAAMFFLWFPEFGDDPVPRIIGFTNAVVSFLSGVFGLAVTIPNVPRKS